MLVTPLTSAQIDAYNASSTASQNSTTPQSSQDSFLKMLTAQLANQDPLNPMDNAQMTSQMAQINTVSGIQQLNQTMTSMAAQFGSMQALQGASLIGRQAMVAGSQPLVADGVAKGAFSLAGAADSVKVDVLGTSGAVLGTVTLGAQQAGQQFFEVPLTGIDPTKVAKFSVTATAQGKAVTATPISLQPVTSVAMANGTLKLTTSTGTSYTYDQVLGYR